MTNWKKSISAVSNSIAVGTDSQASGESSIAVGYGAFASSSSATAVGRNARVLASNGNAFGNGATVNAGHANSSAIGSGASTTFNNQMMLGTNAQTYTTPGITSGLSKARQSGPVEIVTSDANGNLATDGGNIFNALSKVGGGVSIAMAMENPDLVGNETFGISGNVSYWEENVALGFSAMGVVGRNVLGKGERLAISGAVGFTVEERNFGGQNDKQSVGGRAGMQMTW